MSPKKHVTTHRSSRNPGEFLTGFSPGRRPKPAIPLRASTGGFWAPRFCIGIASLCGAVRTSLFAAVSTQSQGPASSCNLTSRGVGVGVCVCVFVFEKLRCEPESQSGR